jgi:hypothetical protein
LKQTLTPDRLRAALRRSRGRLAACGIVIAAAAVTLAAVHRAVPAPVEPIADSAVPLAAVALRGADVASSAANLTALNAVTQADLVPTDYAVTLDRYASTQLESFAVQGWQATPYTVAYASADESVCTVDETGLVTAVAPGVTTITAAATDAGGTTAAAQCTVTVRDAPPPVTAIALNRTQATLRMGGTGSDLRVSCTPEAYQSVLPAAAYASSDESVCTVDETGHVTAVAPGTAVVTASVLGLSAECSITVKDAPSTQTVSQGGISLLGFDHSLIAGIGNQSAGRCSWYALRYARTILDGTACSGSGMWSGGVIWSAGGYTNYSGDLSSCLSEIYAELAAGRPVIAHLQNTYVPDGNKHQNRVSSYEYWESGSGWNAVLYPHIATSSTYGHWVCIVGVSDGADPNNLMESDFYALDPARVTDGSAICVTRLLDGTLWTANSPLKVAG